MFSITLSGMMIMSSIQCTRSMKPRPLRRRLPGDSSAKEGEPIKTIYYSPDGMRLRCEFMPHLIKKNKNKEDCVFFEFPSYKSASPFKSYAYVVRLGCVKEFKDFPPVPEGYQFHTEDSMKRAYEMAKKAYEIAKNFSLVPKSAGLYVNFRTMSTLEKLKRPAVLRCEAAADGCLKWYWRWGHPHQWIVCSDAECRIYTTMLRNQLSTVDGPAMSTVDGPAMSTVDGPGEVDFATMSTVDGKYQLACQSGRNEKGYYRLEWYWRLTDRSDQWKPFSLGKDRRMYIAAFRKQLS